MASTMQQIENLSSQIVMLTDWLNSLNKQMEQLKAKEEQEQKAKRIAQHKPTLSWDCFPQEVKEIILDFNGLLEENKKKFSDLVKPLIITEKYLHEIKKIQKENPKLSRFEFRHTATYPGNFDVILDGRSIFDVHVDKYHIKCGWGSIMRLYDVEWMEIDDFIRYLIHHYIDGHPFIVDVDMYY